MVFAQYFAQWKHWFPQPNPQYPSIYLVAVEHQVHQYSVSRLNLVQGPLDQSLQVVYIGFLAILATLLQQYVVFADDGKGREIHD